MVRLLPHHDVPRNYQNFRMFNCRARASLQVSLYIKKGAIFLKPGHFVQETTQSPSPRQGKI